MAIRGDIEAANNSLVRAVAARDPAAVASHYTDEARIFAPAMPLVDGRPAVEGFFKQAIDAGFFDGLSVETDEVEDHGDLAIELGRWSTSGGGGKYIVVWAVTPDGPKLRLDFFNSDSMPGTA